MSRPAILVISLVLLAAPRGVQALSIACSPPEEHFFFDCLDRVCVPLFRATPVRENACEWRLVIEPIEQWASDALLAEAGRREIQLEGVLQVSIHRSLISPEREDEHWTQIEGSEMATRPHSPKAVRLEWEELAAEQLWEARKMQFLVWGAFIGILGILISAGRFVWLRGFRERNARRGLAAVAIGVQLLVAVACSVPAYVVYETGIGTMAPIGLLAPGAFTLIGLEALALSARGLLRRAQACSCE